MNDVAQSVAQMLLDAEAVKISIDPPFTWTSGIRGPIYCDNRKLVSSVEDRAYIVSEFVNLMNEKGLKPDYIAGTAMAAIPWAAFVAYELKLPMIYVRPEPKEHGAKKQIEGDLKPGSTVLLIEDLFSTGGSSVKSLQAIREEGQSVCDHVFAIVTYGFEKARKAFEEAQVEAVTLTDLGAIVEEAAERGTISQGDVEMVKEFAKDPEGWAEKL